jgi:hypothetical protein
MKVGIIDAAFVAGGIIAIAALSYSYGKQDGVRELCNAIASKAAIELPCGTR